jgi:hypothetical protein
VEQFDRLSRDEVLAALNLFTSILRAGVEVYTCIDRMHYTYKSVNENPVQLIISIVAMMKSHQESRDKGVRVTAAWRQKQLNAAKEPMTKRTPAWIELKDGKYHLIPERKRIVMDIVDKAVNGNGCTKIAQMLNTDGVPSWNGKPWATSTIFRMLQTKMIIGEYQPHHHVKGRRLPLGDPISMVYPPVITEDRWYQLQAALKSRRDHSGGKRNESQLRNLFGKLLHDWWHDSPVQIMYRTKSKEGFLMASHSRTQKPAKGKEFVSFPYQVFETCVLNMLPELMEVPTVKPHNDTTALEGKALEQERRIKVIQSQMTDTGTPVDIKALVPVLRHLEAAHRDTLNQIQSIKVANSQGNVKQEEFIDLVDEMFKANRDQRYQLRTQLRSMMARLIHGIEVRVTRERLPHDWHDGQKVTGYGGRRETVYWKRCEVVVQMQSSVPKQIVLRCASIYYCYQGHKSWWRWEDTLPTQFASTALLVDEAAAEV